MVADMGIRKPQGASGLAAGFGENVSNLEFLGVSSKKSGTTLSHTFSAGGRDASDTRWIVTVNCKGDDSEVVTATIAGNALTLHAEDVVERRSGSLTAAVLSFRGELSDSTPTVVINLSDPATGGVIGLWALTDNGSSTLVTATASSLETQTQDANIAGVGAATSSSSSSTGWDWTGGETTEEYDVDLDSNDWGSGSGGLSTTGSLTIDADASSTFDEAYAFAFWY